ncbi:uncharacterized protein EDB91DRAFT_1259055 [Suillus paluster]|uniref:uncharacterized protein n=1 Tax=Suillus paluster TaxID=48578 RepID=UPI001B886283|nr:uncharacterized protein EDB91DRAFT_1259055 [Suillus paluster]KAG1717953.1 hypothetical protein EDB91DRAFT_1259055 [Suillus paluster]
MPRYVSIPLRVLYLPIYMEDLICLGCMKVFPSQKRLSGHEAQCEANKLPDADGYKSQHYLEKGQRRQRNTSPEADVQMDLGDDYVNTEYGDTAGPLGYIPEVEPPVPTPDAPAVVSAHSGQLSNSPRSHAPNQLSGGGRPSNQPIKVQPEQPQAPDSPASKDIPHQPPPHPIPNSP